MFIFFENYSDNGFAYALDSATQLAMEIGLDTTFCKRRVVERKIHFDENTNDTEVVRSTEEYFRIDYILYIVDKAMTTVKVRLEQFCHYENIFGFF